MENKFKPIAMKCNEAQYKDIKPILIKNNIKIVDIENFERFGYLTNFYNGKENIISNVVTDNHKAYNRLIFKEWNKYLFLKSCGIEEEIDYTKYIGRKVKGFKYNSEYYNHGYMDKHIGEIGKIINHKNDGFYLIQFNENSFYYPAEETLKHLIEEETDVLKETPFHKPDFSHLGKFVNLSSKFKEKKETILTHGSLGEGWYKTDYKVSDPRIKKLYYHGELSNSNGYESLFVAEIEGRLFIFKGVKGDEFE